MLHRYLPAHTCRDINVLSFFFDYLFVMYLERFKKTHSRTLLYKPWIRDDDSRHSLPALSSTEERTGSPETSARCYDSWSEKSIV